MTKTEANIIDALYCSLSNKIHSNYSQESVIAMIDFILHHTNYITNEQKNNAGYLLFGHRNSVWLDMLIKWKDSLPCN